MMHNNKTFKYLYTNEIIYWEGKKSTKVDWLSKTKNSNGCDSLISTNGTTTCVDVAWICSVLSFFSLVWYTLAVAGVLKTIENRNETESM